MLGALCAGTGGHRARRGRPRQWAAPGTPAGDDDRAQHRSERHVRAEVRVRRRYKHLQFRFYLEANNPSKVVFIRFDNITVKLYDTSPPKEESLFAGFDLDPPLLSLSQMEEQEYFVHSSYVANATSTHAEDKLYRVATTDDHDVEGAVMVLSGKLSVSNYIKPGTATSHIFFRCEPVTLKRYTKLAQPSSGNFKGTASKCEFLCYYWLYVVVRFNFSSHELVLIISQCNNKRC
ncbi:hypothetical protein PVAP13_6NG160900 [Panicum virgatum]|uniref:Uncharacterized protein n=1 Tax=Panicum virgatum TaxID=38727 RepID=A0A8T0QWK1_PANVG|nr:hypothetical protein PVAP13_6NG160900 [Panicum virgatum]